MTEMIGMKLRRLRNSRRIPLAVVADLAGVRKADLLNLEDGKRCATSMTELAALATALRVPLSALTTVPSPGVPDDRTDVAVDELRVALDAVDAGRPAGSILPLWVLQEQVAQLRRWRRACRFEDVAVRLPELVRDVHTTLDSGVERRELLGLAVHLHVHVTRLWLAHAYAPTDLQRRVVFLAKHLAETSEDHTLIAVASFGIADTLGRGGAFLACHDELAVLRLPAPTPETAGLVGMATLLHAVPAQHEHRPWDVIAAIDTASDLASRFGTGGVVDGVGFYTGPVDVAVFRMFLALEQDDPEEAVAVAEETPPQHPFVTIRTSYWMTYGRALTRVGGRDGDAVRALLMAEGLFPAMVHRAPLVLDAVGELVTRSRGDDLGLALRAMAHRAGLSVSLHEEAVESWSTTN